MRWAAAVGIMLAAWGCGGSGGSGEDSVQTVQPRIPVRWDARSRSAVGPSAALSVRATFVQGPAGSPVRTAMLDRRAEPAAYNSIMVGNDRLKEGPYQVAIEFFPHRGAQGAVIARADFAGVLTADGTFRSPDGTPLPNIVTGGKIKSLTPVNTVIGIEPTQLRLTATTDAGEVVALEDGGVFFQLSTATGNPTLTPGGIIDFDVPGEATIKTLSGSVGWNYTIRASVQSTWQSYIQARKVVGSAATSKAYIATSSTIGPYGLSMVEMDAETGAFQRHAPLDYPATDIVLSPSGTVAYAILDNKLKTVDLATMTVVNSFEVPLGQYIARFVVCPDDPHLSAATIGPVGADQPTPTPVVILKTGQPNRTLQVRATSAIAWIDANTLHYGENILGSIGTAYAVDIRTEPMTQTPIGPIPYRDTYRNRTLILGDRIIQIDDDQLRIYHARTLAKVEKSLPERFGTMSQSIRGDEFVIDNSKSEVRSLITGELLRRSIVEPRRTVRDAPITDRLRGVVLEQSVVAYEVYREVP